MRYLLGNLSNEVVLAMATAVTQKSEEPLSRFPAEQRDRLVAAFRRVMQPRPACEIVPLKALVA
jgi:hypothetical protein